MHRSTPLLLCLLTFALAGCRDSTVVSYRIPKEKEPPAPIASAPATMPAPAASSSKAAPATPADMASTAVVQAAGVGLTWTAPAHWKTNPASAMRKASYTIENASAPPSAGTTSASGTAAVGDLSITAFPGDVGGDLANVNRWRGQLQLPPLAQGELASNLTRFDVAGLGVTVVDFAGGAAANPQRVLGAIVPYDGSTWFVKLSGPEPLVAQEKPAFLAFLQTLRRP